MSATDSTSKKSKKTATSEISEYNPNLRTPPHNLTMEQAVLAALMTVAESWESVADVLLEGDFYATRHRHIFHAIKKLADSNQPYDAVMVNDWLTNQHMLEDAGGEAYLMQLLTESPPSLFNLTAYAEKVKETATLRHMITVGNDILRVAYDPKGHLPKLFIYSLNLFVANSIDSYLSSYL